LAGTIGLQNSQAIGLFNVNQWFTNFATNLLLPVFDGDRLESNVTLAEARFKEVAAAYGRTVVTAVNEVQTAMAGMQHEDRRHAFLAARLEEAQAEVELQSERYGSGVGSYADFLDALRAQLNVESALAGSERDRALARLGIHRALGGTWTAPDLAERPPAVPASMQPGRRSE
ncbi:MAG: TolC family protein, partial [Acidobacteriota bacterium]|nr:TolC family protein [Acidobacteriota bacterium]